MVETKIIDSNPGNSECECGRGPKEIYLIIWEAEDGGTTEQRNIMCPDCYREVFEVMAVCDDPTLVDLANETLAGMALADQLPSGDHLILVYENDSNCATE